MIIVVDTNILWTAGNTPWRDTTTWNMLLLMAEVRTDVVMIVPDIVVREHANHEALAYRQAHKKAGRALRSAEFEAKRAGIDLTRPLAPAAASVDATTPPTRTTIASEMRHSLSHAGIVVAPLPAVTHQELVDWSLDANPPFDSTDKGYRDALLWWSIREIANHHPGDVIFVTNDKDFRQGEALHPVLSGHFATEHPKRAVIMVDKLLDAFDHLPELPDLDDSPVEFPSIESIVTDGLTAALEQLSGADLRHNYDQHDTLDISAPPDVENATVISLEPLPDTVRIDTQGTLDGDITLGSVTATVEVHYEGYVHKAEQFVDQPDWTVVNSNWTRHYVVVEGYLTAEMEFSFIVAGEGLTSLDLVDAHELPPETDHTNALPEMEDL